MRIEYDAALMAQMISACQTANNGLEKAQNLLREIGSHSDWNCKERTSINEMIAACKKAVGKLNTDQMSFLTSVRQVGIRFAEKEKEISSLFDTVDGLLAKILSVQPAVSFLGGAGLLGGSGGSQDSGTSVGQIGQTVSRFAEDILKRWSTVNGTSKETISDQYAELKSFFDRLTDPLTVCRMSDLDL